MKSRAKMMIRTLLLGVVLALALGTTAAFADDGTKLAAPEGLKWSFRWSFYGNTEAVWKPSEANQAEDVKEYWIYVTWMDGTDLATSDVAKTPGRPWSQQGELYQSYTSFVHEHGSGTYTFHIKTVAKAESGKQDSDYVASEPLQIQTLELESKYYAEDGTPIESPGNTDVFITDEPFDSGKSLDFSEEDTIYMEKGTSWKLKALTEKGYDFKGFTFTPSDGVSVDGKNAFFTADQDLKAVLAFQQNNAKADIFVDFGTGHETMAKKIADILNAEEPGFCTVVDGSVIKAKHLRASVPVFDVMSEWDTIINDNMEHDPMDYSVRDAGKIYRGIGTKPLEEYASEEDYEADLNAQEKKDLEDQLTIIVIWLTPIQKGEASSFTMKAPVCGTEVQYHEESSGFVISGQPEIEEADSANKIELDMSFNPVPAVWAKGDGMTGEYMDRENIEGGKKYTALIDLIPKWGYAYDEMSSGVPDVKIIVNGKEAKWFYPGVFSFEIEAAHDWGEGTVIKKATAKAQGQTEFVCMNCGTKNTVTIPKIPTAKATVNYAKKSVKTSWKKVNDAVRYVVSYRKAGAKKWTTKKTTKTALTLTKQKNKGAYQYRVASVANVNGIEVTGAYSKIQYKYINAKTLKLTRRKKALKVMWKKDTNVTRYKIRYSLKSSMKSAKTKYVGGKKNSVVIRNLKRSKRYYVELTPLKKVQGRQYTGQTKIKSAKTK